MNDAIRNPQSEIRNSSARAVFDALEESAPRLSVIMPIGSRFDDLAAICQTLRRVLDPLVHGYEVLIVDDATGPHTRLKIRQSAARFPEARVIRLQRHVDEATALAIGAQEAQGDLIITLDPYLHVAVEELPRLLEPVMDGMDLACARRISRQERGLSRWASQAFNAAARWLTKVPVHDLNCRTRAMKRELLDELPLYGDLHRFLPIFAARRGYRWCEIDVTHQAGKREIGARHPRSYLRAVLDLATLAFLTRFMKRPLHFFGLIGMASLTAGVVLGGYLAAVKWLYGVGIGHRPLLLLSALLIVVGIQVASIGLLGEIMIFTHVRHLKDYVIREERG